VGGEDSLIVSNVIWREVGVGSAKHISLAECLRREAIQQEGMAILGLPLLDPLYLRVSCLSIGLVCARRYQLSQQGLPREEGTRGFKYGSCGFCGCEKAASKIGGIAPNII
jgi:hypothetical protein